MKIIDKIQEWKKNNPGRPFFSFEFFPPKTETGLLNLYDRLDRLTLLDPLWIDVTWGAGGSTATRTMEICASALKYHGLEPLIHLTCTNMSVDLIDQTLNECKSNGIRNILALRGDPPADQETWTAAKNGFSYAADLVRYIRKNYGDYFCIGVAGYPEGHLENPDQESDLIFLKMKVDAGADLVITQLFYDNEEFLRFMDSCKHHGITCPIIPGMLPIQSYAGFTRMTKFCKTKVPPSITDALERIKEDEQSVKDYGVNLCVEMCRELIEHGVEGLHFYTLNLEVSTVRVIHELHLIDLHVSQRALPWKPLLRERAKEDVRPIFWANRPRSYIHRTAAWDDFPNGRWGSRDSPAYGEPMYSVCTDPDERSMTHRREMWGPSPASIEDIKSVFVEYLKPNSRVVRLPWCPEVLGGESLIISKQLTKLNNLGILTINSQPRVNGALSTDPTFGWGPKGGFVYQKAYVEFFCSPDALEVVVEALEKDISMTYIAANAKGDVRTNCEGSVNAVTWGVFPGAEVKQPTIVDFASFLAWKDEAFSLWKVEWASIYPPDSPSRLLLNDMEQNWFLVDVVDNNFVSGDLFNVLINILSTSASSTPTSARGNGTGRSRTKLGDVVRHPELSLVNGSH